MSSKSRRFEVLLPVRFNDGRDIPEELLGEAVNEIVSQFGAVHRNLFPPDSLGGRSFATLAAAVRDAGTYATSQAQETGTARSGALSKAAARYGGRLDKRSCRPGCDRDAV